MIFAWASGLLVIWGVEPSKKWSIRSQFFLASGHQSCYVSSGFDFLSRICPFVWNAGFILELCGECFRFVGVWPSPVGSWAGEWMWMSVRCSDYREGWAQACHFFPFGHTWDGKRTSMARWVAIPRESKSVPLGLEVPFSNCPKVWSWIIVVLLLKK